MPGIEVERVFMNFDEFPEVKNMILKKASEVAIHFEDIEIGIRTRRYDGIEMILMDHADFSKRRTPKI